MCTITDLHCMRTAIEHSTKVIHNLEYDLCIARNENHNKAVRINALQDMLKMKDQQIKNLTEPRDYSESFGSIGRSHVTPTDVRTREGK